MIRWSKDQSQPWCCNYTSKFFCNFTTWYLKDVIDTDIFPCIDWRKNKRDLIETTEKSLQQIREQTKKNKDEHVNEMVYMIVRTHTMSWQWPRSKATILLHRIELVIQKNVGSSLLLNGHMRNPSVCPWLVRYIVWKSWFCILRLWNNYENT